jgi:hypothetical protein
MTRGSSIDVCRLEQRLWQQSGARRTTLERAQCSTAHCEEAQDVSAPASHPV